MQALPGLLIHNGTCRERAVSKRRRMMAADLDDGKLAVLTGHDDDDNADASSQRASGAQESTSRILRDAEGSALLPFDSSQSPRDSPQETPQEAPPGGTSPPQTKVALAFFGLTRSLKFTIDSIRQNVLAPLDEAAIEYDIYLHSYDLESITNSRSAEIGQSLNTTEWKLLDPDFVSITDQARHHACVELRNYLRLGLTVTLQALGFTVRQPPCQTCTPARHVQVGCEARQPGCASVACDGNTVAAAIQRKQRVFVRAVPRQSIQNAALQVPGHVLPCPYGVRRQTRAAFLP